MGRRLQRWRALSAADRARLLACLGGLWILHASLALAGYRRTRAGVERLSRHPRPRPADAADLDAARALARLAASAGQHGMGPATCLRRALLLHGWLRRRGLAPTLQLGVATDVVRAGVEGADGGFRAHAWVELDGVLLESDSDYRPFKRKTHAPESGT